MTQSSRNENPIEVKIRQATQNVLEKGIGGGASDSDMNLAAFGWLAAQFRAALGNPGHNGSRRDRMKKAAGPGVVGGGTGILILEAVRAFFS